MTSDRPYRPFTKEDCYDPSVSEVPDEQASGPDAVHSEDPSEENPSSTWDRDWAKRAIDELFCAARYYRNGQEYLELMRFIGRFRTYSPFNAMLIHIQRPGARYVAPLERWMAVYHRTIKPGARPLVILRPMGPVMFVFDVSDTEGQPLPPEIENPFGVRKGFVGHQLECIEENAKRDGINLSYSSLGSQMAGSISVAHDRRGEVIDFRDQAIPLAYHLQVNSNLSREAKYVTIAHELGHLYCGHLGTPDARWWPDREDLPRDTAEFEAESVAFLLCSRLGLDNPSDRYLSGYLKAHEETPPISLESVVKAAGLIESMGRGRLKLRSIKKLPK